MKWDRATQKVPDTAIVRLPNFEPTYAPARLTIPPVSPKNYVALFARTFLLSGTFSFISVMRRFEKMFMMLQPIHCKLIE